MNYFKLFIFTIFIVSFVSCGPAPINKKGNKFKIDLSSSESKNSDLVEVVLDGPSNDERIESDSGFEDDTESPVSIDGFVDLSDSSLVEEVEIEDDPLGPITDHEGLINGPVSYKDLFFDDVYASRAANVLIIDISYDGDEFLKFDTHNYLLKVQAYFKDEHNHSRSINLELSLSKVTLFPNSNISFFVHLDNLVSYLPDDFLIDLNVIDFYKFIVILDPENQVIEADESNNVRIINI